MLLVFINIDHIRKKKKVYSEPNKRYYGHKNRNEFHCKRWNINSENHQTKENHKAVYLPLPLAETSTNEAIAKQRSLEVSDVLS